jgi:hypothetical protein
MNPIDYLFCDRTVTVYRKEQGQVKRLVVENCFYHHQLVQRETDYGKRLDRLFLLVMPGKTQRVFVGDRIYDGIGPGAEDVDWAAFVPAAVAGLSQVAYVTPWYWDGELSHVEAGRK